MTTKASDWSEHYLETQIALAAFLDSALHHKRKPQEVCDAATKMLKHATQLHAVVLTQFKVPG